MSWLAGAAVSVFGFVLAVVIGVTSSSAAACGGGGGAVTVSSIPSDATSGAYGAEQMINAGHIMNAAAALGLPVRAQQIGVMTAMGESSLRSIDYGDWETGGVTNPDGSPTTSIGLFQQQESWGSTADRMDPEISATLFFERLVTIDGWESMAPSAAAHKVQINSDPDHYTTWWDAAVALTDDLARSYGSGGDSGSACMTGEAGYPLDQPYTMTSGFGPRDAPAAGASTWHPAIDLVGGCDAPIYVALPGTVVRSDRLYLGIQSPDGFVVEYLHSYPSDRTVKEGDTVVKGQQIAAVGDVPPASGCHLDIRVNVSKNTNPQVAQLPTFPEAPGYVEPVTFFEIFGLEICPPDWCRKAY